MRRTLIAQGADVVTHHTDSTAVVAAAEEAEDGGRLPLEHGEVRSQRPAGGGDASLGRLLHAALARSSTAAGRSHRSGAESRTVIRLQGLADNLPPDLVEAVKTRQEADSRWQVSPVHAPIRTNTGKDVLASVR